MSKRNSSLFSPDNRMDNFYTTTYYFYANKLFYHFRVKHSISTRMSLMFVYFRIASIGQEYRIREYYIIINWIKGRVIGVFVWGLNFDKTKLFSTRFDKVTAYSALQYDAVLWVFNCDNLKFYLRPCISRWLCKNNTNTRGAIFLRVV